jgi:hypothetical protein
MDATGQHQHAAEIAALVRHVHLGIERSARTLEGETLHFFFSATRVDLGGSHRGVDAAVAQNPAKAGRDVKI